jgi:hypothetical protein
VVRPLAHSCPSLPEVGARAAALVRVPKSPPPPPAEMLDVKNPPEQVRAKEKLRLALTRDVMRMIHTRASLPSG